jgi:ribosomal-protein-alanine N-acetyltransferase
MIIFTTERLIICQYSPGDFHDFFRLNSDEEVMRYIRQPQSHEQAKEFFAKILASYKEQPGLGRWAMLSKEGDEFLGSFAVIPVENSTDIQIGYALLKKNWGLGYASESVRGGLQYVFNHLKLESVLAITEVENTDSQKVLIKNGFVTDGTRDDGKRQLLQFICKRS